MAMKILVISDTHGQIHALVDNLLPRYKHQIEYVFHLGDHAHDVAGLSAKYPNINFVAVPGNSDHEPELEKEKVLTLGHGVQRKFLLLHGHTKTVTFGNATIAHYAEEKGVDMVIYGHTHKPCNEFVHNVLVFNPGSLTSPRGGSLPGYGLITLSDNGNISTELRQL